MNFSSGLLHSTARVWKKYFKISSTTVRLLTAAWSSRTEFIDIEWPEDEEDQISEEAQDLILKLLAIQPAERLGTNGAEDVKNHPFFGDINWDTLMDETPLFVPQHMKDAADTTYFDGLLQLTPLSSPFPPCPLVPLSPCPPPPSFFLCALADSCLQLVKKSSHYKTCRVIFKMTQHPMTIVSVDFRSLMLTTLKILTKGAFSRSIYSSNPLAVNNIHMTARLNVFCILISKQ